MPNPNTLNKQTTPNNTPAFPWAQYISRQGWVGSGEMSIGSASFCVVFDVDGGFLNQLGSQILGWSQKKGDGTLGRTLPMVFPPMPWMVATRISHIEGIKPTEKHQYDGGPWQDYDRYRVTVLFEAVNYRVAADGNNFGSEHNRFTIKTTESVSTLANLDRGAYAWAPTGVGGTPADIGGTPLELGISIPIQRIRLKWKWLQVPLYPGIYDKNGIAKNIFACVNKVNTQSFGGFNPGTVLMEDPVIEPRVLPIDPNLIGPVNDPINGGMARCADVTFSFIYFEPVVVPGNDWTISGHNLSIWAPAGQASGWYPIRAAKTGVPLFDGADLNTVFTLV